MRTNDALKDHQYLKGFKHLFIRSGEDPLCVMLFLPATQAWWTVLSTVGVNAWSGMMLVADYRAIVRPSTGWWGEQLPEGIMLSVT